ncbi:hypothetical protein KIN20_003736 [Parelaphostrongylus tenuis]|uniref:Mos1 transposase HTH domain-containing protein n=1 Tax=Parelaphostrongylus tenuis TaxID=148309 RepID=A0AAD5MIQ8_PARTN|nr:hypothetical protein KIN20_003736 [Parelaphostrongylus tenuis]
MPSLSLNACCGNIGQVRPSSDEGVVAKTLALSGLSREQKRLMMLHEYRLGSNAAKNFRRMNEVWDDGAVEDSAVFDRFNEFKNGNKDLTHKQRAATART